MRSLLLSASAMVALVAIAVPRAFGDERPNVVWIVADDVSPDLGCYGAKAVATPHVDRLARQGIRFTNVFATSPVCSPSRSAFVTGTYQTTIGAHHHRTRRMRPLPEDVETVMQRFRTAGYFVTNGDVDGKKAKTDYNFTHDLSRLFDGTDWRKRPAGRPFFAQIQIKEPHRAFVKNEDPTRPGRLVVPPVYPDHPITRADWANYFATVEVMDAKVGRVLDQLDDAGVAESTFVVFFGDHGRPHVWAKQWLYDAGLRVPLIVRRPGNKGAGTVDDRLVSLIDLAPTSLAACGLTSPAGCRGRDLFDPLAPARDTIFAARDRCGDAFDRIRCVRTKRFSYIRNFEPERPYTQLSGYKKLQYPVVTLLPVLQARGELSPIAVRFLAKRRPPEELYDVSVDPFQTRNLAGEPSHAKTLADLRERLDHWMEETDDQGRHAEGDAEFVAKVLAEKRAYYERTMRRRGLDPDISDVDYLDWWRKELGVDESATGPSLR